MSPVEAAMRLARRTAQPLRSVRHRTDGESRKCERAEMSIIKQVYAGLFTTADDASPSLYEVTCRLVTNHSGLESLHLSGWVTRRGIQIPLRVIGITSPQATMHGCEHAIAMQHVAQVCDDDRASQSWVQEAGTPALGEL